MQEIESVDEFDRLIASGLTRLRGWHLQSLDLTGRGAALAAATVAGGVFLGCRFPSGDAPGNESEVRRRGGLVFPTVPAVPFDPYRGSLYSPDELYAGLDDGYASTADARSYAWSREPRSLDRTLAAALHDHAIGDAFEEFVATRELVGVMGGHAVRRDEPEYRAATALGRSLASRFTVATGGGPGAMEAANLGAWLVGRSDAELDEAVAILATAPDFSADLDAWARTAFEVRARWSDGGESVGVPTWFYGHEPPNALASVIAKYFSNATREDVLLQACRGGLVFLPGAAGTVQEIFQAACSNYYATPGRVAPMVLVGHDHWTREVGVWDLLRTLGSGRAFGTRLEIVDDPEDVLPLLVEHRRDRG